MNSGRKVFAVFKIIRPANVLITFATIFLAGVICAPGTFPAVKILLASFSGAFVAAAGNVINDYFDVEIDKINRPERVIPQNILTKKDALILFAVLKFFAFFLSLQINLIAFAIVIVTSILLFLYSLKLKRIALIGNLTVAFLTGLAFIYGAVAVGNWSGGIFPALFAFLVNFAREILKDIEDIEGDAKMGIATFPIKAGIAKSNFLISATLILLILLTPVPYFMKIYNIQYFIFVLIIVDSLFVFFLKELNSKEEKKNLRKLGNLLKINMILGLTAIYLGSNLFG